MSRMRNMLSLQRARADAGAFDLTGIVAPISGTSGTGVEIAGAGSIYYNTANGVVYVNEGTRTSPYWTPMNLRQPNLLAWDTDFRDGVGVAASATTAMVTLAGSGIRLFGTGIEETDSGLTVAIGEDGPIASAIASATSGKILAIGVGLTTSVPFQPDTHSRLVVEALVAMSSAITARSLFLGFIGTAADALLPPVTGATITATLVQDDLAGVIFDSALTAASRLYAVHNKSDEAASQLVTTGGRDSSVDFPAADVYTRLRVEISEGGDMLVFKDKVQILSIVDALDADEEVAPVLLVRSLASATKTMLVKYFRTWGNRVA